MRIKYEIIRGKNVVAHIFRGKRTPYNVRTRSAAAEVAEETRETETAAVRSPVTEGESNE